jgi:phosphatidylglycerol:prolipoprotein diacylglycerol transferase
MLGALAAAYLAEREARRRGLDSEVVWDALLWLVIAGIVGARLWHVFTPPPSMVAVDFDTAYYLTHPLRILTIWDGGLGIPGAVIGGGLALYWYTRRKGLSFALWADIAAPALALGQAIGRWGNFVNQELYGLPTNLPWAIYIDPQYRLTQYLDISYYHPLFLYESLWNLGNMFFLLWLGRRYARRLLAGDLMLVYLITYPVGRFLLEFIRADAPQAFGINTNQTVMAIVAVAAAALLVLRHRRAGTAMATTAGAAGGMAAAALVEPPPLLEPLRPREDEDEDEDQDEDQDGQDDGGGESGDGGGEG